MLLWRIQLLLRGYPLFSQRSGRAVAPSHQQVSLVGGIWYQLRRFVWATEARQLGRGQLGFDVGGSVGALGGRLGGNMRRRRRRARARHSLLLRKWLARFIAHFVSAATYVCITRNAQARLRVADYVFLRFQTQRLFSSMPANNYQLRRLEFYPWQFGATALYLAVALRDPALLVSWLQNRIRLVPLRQHRRFLRTLVLGLRLAVLAPQQRFQLRGLRLYVAGKISVTGNARSRVYQIKMGSQATSNLQLREASTFTIIRTHTGCLGLTLGFYF